MGFNKIQKLILYTLLIIDIAINIIIRFTMKVPSEYYMFIMLITFIFATGIVILKLNDKW